MSSEPTPLLTVEGLLALVAERNALWAKANALSEQIDHVRKFIGEDRFRALVGKQDAAGASFVSPELPLSRRNRNELSIREVILEGLKGKPEGMSYEELKAYLRETGLGARSPNSFWNAVWRMHEQGEAVKVGEHMFSMEDFANLPPEKAARLQATVRKRSGMVPGAVLEALASREAGMLPGEVVAALREKMSNVRDNGVYAALSRLTKDGVLVRDEHHRYWLAKSQSEPAGAA